VIELRNPCIDAAIAELRAVGVYDYKLARGGKHPQLHWGINGARRFYVLPGTPGDWRSVKNVRSEIRRILRTDGLITTPDSLEEPPRPPRPPSLERRMEELERRVAALEAKAGLTTVKDASPFG
jgi:hypothetical protein